MPRNIAIVVIFGFILIGCGGGGGQIGSRDTAHLTPGEPSDPVTQTALSATPQFSPGANSSSTPPDSSSTPPDSLSTPSDLEIYTDMASSISFSGLHDSHYSVEGSTADGGVATNPQRPDFVLSNDVPISVTGFTGSRHVRTMIPRVKDEMDNMNIMDNMDNMDNMVNPDNPSNNDRRQEAILYTDKENADDLHYLDIGYWLWADPHDAIFGDSIAITVVFHASGNSFPDLVEINSQGDDVPTVSGTATYNGQATGLYAKQTAGEYSEGGPFTALASLHADFSLSPELAPHLPKPKAGFFTRVRGLVHSFLDKEGDSIDSSWVVRLQPVIWDTFQDNEPELYIKGKTGDHSRDGWHFRFHGEITGTGRALSPDSAAGAFKKHFDNGVVGGSFGVYKRLAGPPPE